MIQFLLAWWLTRMEWARTIRLLGWATVLLGLWLAELEWGPAALVVGGPLVLLGWWLRIKPPVGVVWVAALVILTVHPIAPAGVVSGALPAAPVTPSSWAQALLGRLGDPVSTENVRAIVAWERAEGGHWQNSASYNPLNTTLPWPPAGPESRPINSVGVQAYTSWDEGLAATVATLRNGRYSGVLAALAAGSCSTCVASAVAASPWGTGWFPV